MMMDREAAAKLGISNPIRPLGFYIKKYSEKGYSGEGLWQRIIQGSATPNKKINNEQGVEIYYYGK